VEKETSAAIPARSVESNKSMLGVVQAMGMAAEQEADGQGDTRLECNREFFFCAGQGQSEHWIFFPGVNGSDIV
jgi:hypothetical protein